MTSVPHVLCVVEGSHRAYLSAIEADGITLSDARDQALVLPDLRAAVMLGWDQLAPMVRAARKARRSMSWSAEPLERRRAEAA